MLQVCINSLFLMMGIIYELHQNVQILHFVFGCVLSLTVVFITQKKLRTNRPLQMPPKIIIYLGVRIAWKHLYHHPLILPIAFHFKIMYQSIACFIAYMFKVQCDISLSVQSELLFEVAVEVSLDSEHLEKSSSLRNPLEIMVGNINDFFAEFLFFLSYFKCLSI